jgi:YjbR
MTLAQIRKHALSLSGTTEEPHFDRTSFRINGKIFITARPSESHIHIFVPDEVREPALAMHPDFVSKLLWGGKVVGVRVELPKADPGVVRDLVSKAWHARAAKLRKPARAGRRS